MMSQRTTDVLMRAGQVALSSSLFLVIVAMSVNGGCGRRGPAADPLSPRADSAVRMTAQPLASLPGRRVSALLDFDSPDDMTFVTSEPPGVIKSDSRLARSGRQSLLISPGTRDVVMKLPSLLSGRSFPADWTLAGAY